MTNTSTPAPSLELARAQRAYAATQPRIGYVAPAMTVSPADKVDAALGRFPLFSRITQARRASR